MRIPSALTDEFSLKLNKVHSSISDAALKAFSSVLQEKETSFIILQYGPIEVVKLKSFYPEDIQEYFKALAVLLKDWHTNGAPSIAPLAGTESNLMKRLSIVFSTELNNVAISCSFNIQYSCKKYYRFDGSINSLQEDLAKIEAAINSVNADMETRIWSKIRQELKERGIPADDESYITTVSRDENYLSELLGDFTDISSKYESLFREKESKVDQLNKEKDQIVRKLQELVVEVNVTNPVVLDDLAVSTRSSGLFVYLDVHNGKGGDPSSDDISKSISEIVLKFKEVEYGLNQVAAVHKHD